MGLLYVITVRNPLDRVLSHFRHERASPKATPLRSLSFRTFVNQTEFVHWKGDFYVRLLGGCGWTIRCEHDPHLNTALKALQFFSAVLITDDPITFSVGARVVLAHKLGWDPAKVDTDGPDHRKGTRVDSRASVELAADPPAFARLAELNRLDLSFHARATELFHSQVVDVLSQGLGLQGNDEQQSKRIAFTASTTATSIVIQQQQPQRQQEQGGGGGERAADAAASTTVARAVMTTMATPVRVLDTILSSSSLMSSGNDPVAAQEFISVSRTWSTRDGDVANSKFLLPPELDRSGFGGHTGTCKGVGGMDVTECRRKLLELTSSYSDFGGSTGRGQGCDALSFKDGQCYLHHTQGSVNFYTDASMGHLFQRLRPLL
mmetsp:Transcript_44722/g.87953  ORF Transcript_44722/g.87953 Transcript_44722/m.87953 type:complete len:377 (+) Transcript_44722:2-1132(+)